MRIDFEIWFRDYLKISGYPFELLSKKEKQEFDVVINVSDEFYYNENEVLSKQGYVCLYFPLAQSSRDMGVVSLFGALTALYQCYFRNKRVLLHCRKGGNRSQMVRAAFYYMMKAKHFELDGYRNMLLHNCQTNHLPDVGKMENWLKRCRVAFDNSGAFKGNMLDWVFTDLKGDDFFQTNYMSGALSAENETK